MARKVVKKSTAATAGARASGPSELVDVKGPLLGRLRGHDLAVRVLLEAVSRSRLASTLLFVGPAGVGKRLAALGLAQCLLCERANLAAPLACGECGACRRIAKGQSENLLVIEPQGAGIKVEQAQDVLRFLNLRQLGRARVVIINDAHLLNPQAGNALLKAFEEPPTGTHFILVTANPGALLATIRSRSQAIRFHALDDALVAELSSAPEWIVRAAQGSLEVANRLSEGSEEWAVVRRSALQVLSEMLEGREPSAESFEQLREMIKERAAALFVTQVWGRALRDFAYVSASGGLPSDRLHVPDQSDMIARGARLPIAWIEQLSDICLQLEQDIHRNVDKTIAFETTCMLIAGAYAGREPRPMLS